MQAAEEKRQPLWSRSRRFQRCWRFVSHQCCPDGSTDAAESATGVRERISGPRRSLGYASGLRPQSDSEKKAKNLAGGGTTHVQKLSRRHRTRAWKLGTKLAKTRGAHVPSSIASWARGRARARTETVRSSSARAASARGASRPPWALGEQLPPPERSTLPSCDGFQLGASAQNSIPTGEL